MSPRIFQPMSLVTDDEHDHSDHTNYDSDLSVCNKSTKPYHVGNKISGHWRKFLCQLTRVGKRGNARPELGQLCVIMSGKVNDDLGQMGTVTNRTPAMVEIAYLTGDHHEITTRLKRPSSLIFLAPGLVIVQKTDGSVWIQPSCVDKSE